MSKVQKMQQVRVQSEDGTTTMTWIREDWAVIGKAITLDDEAKIFYIIDAYPGLVSEKTLSERSRDYRNTRKASDI